MKVKLGLAALITIFLLAGCKKNDATVTPDLPSDAEIVLSKTSVQLGPGRVRDIVIISNNGEDNLSWSVDSKPDWVRLSESSSVLAKDGYEPLEVSFNQSALAHGNYSGTIQIVSNGGDVEITVTLNHLAANLVIQPGALYFDRNNLLKELIMKNEGTDSLSYEITQFPEWIALSGDSTGTLDKPDTMLVEARPWGMDYGDYEGLISIASNGGDREVTVDLTFHREIEVFPGIEAARVNIGDLYQEVLDTYGQHDFAQYDIETGIHTIGYSWIGLHVFFLSNDLVLYPTVPCYEVTLEDPYDGLIDHENSDTIQIGLGSTRDEIVAVFGEPDSQNNGEEIYDVGIAFTYSSNQLSKIRVWEP